MVQKVKLPCHLLLLPGASKLLHGPVRKQWRTEGWGFGGLKPPPPEIPKTLQNRAKLSPIVKTVKNC